jgi:putative membrane protein
MSMPAQPPHSFGPSDYLAAERTFLAWIRTGLALMGFGFVVARFGLFLQEIHVVAPNVPAPRHGLSIWFGNALIAAGVIMDIFAAWHHVRMVHQLNRGETQFTRPSRGAVVLAGFLALVGIAMVIYLMVF